MQYQNFTYFLPGRFTSTSLSRESSIYLVVLLEMPAIINVLTFSQNDKRSLNSQYIIQMIMDARRGLLLNLKSL